MDKINDIKWSKTGKKWVIKDTCFTYSDYLQHHTIDSMNVQLTHWGRAKMAAVSQTTLSNAFSWMKMLEFRLKFHWSLFLRVVFNNNSLLVQIMAWRRSGDKLLSEPMMVSLLTHVCVTWPQWVNQKKTLLCYYFSMQYLQRQFRWNCFIIAHVCKLHRYNHWN